jgi:hypothetical protein
MPKTDAIRFIVASLTDAVAENARLPRARYQNNGDGTISLTITCKHPALIRRILQGAG